MSTIDTFDLAGALPTGRLAIEASAGTGKTFTLSTLAARYVAEQGVPVGEILIVTFTRAAAAELKDRVRSRLVQFDECLSGQRTPESEVETVVCSTDTARRARRVTAALNEFDSATITTIHGFAQQVLGTLGSASPTDPDAVLLDDTADLVRQVATDMLVTEALLGEHPDDDVPSLDDLVGITLQTLGNPGAVVVPGTDPADSSDAAALMRTMVDQVCEGVRLRRLSAGTMSFDDLLVRLRSAVQDPASGPSTCALLRDRFRIALIDEFQDTDPVQWDIFRTVFADEPASGEARSTLVLVGDPKQAIYGFRGANVHTYLQAAHAPGTDRVGLNRNWRSDPAVLDATARLLAGSSFGHPDITFSTVTAANADEDRRARTEDGDPFPALSIRVADHEDLEPKKEHLTVDAAAKVSFAEMAVHVRNLLEEMHIPDKEAARGMRPLRPNDCAVLVRTGKQKVQARDALRNLGIPAVISGGEDVLSSEAATHWHHLLSAVARPADTRRARAAALGWFIGWSATELAAASEAALSDLQEKLHEWGEHLSRHGIASFIGRLRAESGVEGRVLRLADGDRAMTDLDHVAEILTMAAGSNPSPASLLSTFETLSAGSDDGDPESDLAARRIESEGASVQVMTVHVAKGLEFPVVCCPGMWWARSGDDETLIWWDEADGVRTIDVASSLEWGTEDDLAERKALSKAEALGGDLRLTYVALTRARHHTAIWWAPTKASEKTGLARLLLARDSDGHVDPEAFHAPTITCSFHDGLAERLASMVDASDGSFEVTSIGQPKDERAWIGAPTDERGELEVATLERELSRDGTRWSFTALTRREEHGPGGVHAGRGIDPLDDSAGDAGSADESNADEPFANSQAHSTAGSGDAGDTGDELPLGSIAGGAGFGSLVHEVLERVDFTDGDLADRLQEAIAERLAWNPWEVDRTQLTDGLLAAIETPLGALFADRPLRDFSPRDRIDEFEFDLTLGEGPFRATDRDVGALLLDHLEHDAPLRPWAEHVASGPFAAVLEGHLTGSIDLVARVRHKGRSDTFVVADYKTNRLVGGDRVPNLEMFRPDHLTAAMADHHYPLQAILYSVALHRYLRQRLPGYEPGTHLGGIAYLFVRGMVGADTPTFDATPYGVFEWRPPAALVTDLSDLLDGVAEPIGSTS